MPNVPDQTAAITSLVAQNRYDLAYRYIADQIQGDPAWNQKLVSWFNDAAAINGSEPNFLKSFVFTSNALAGKLDPDSAATDLLNQQTSDRLADRIISDYLNAIRNDSVLTPAEIYSADVNSVSENFNVPEHRWAGGPLAALLYDFPVEDSFDSLADIEAWFDNAVRTALVLAGDSALEAIQLLLGIPKAIHDVLMKLDDSLEKSLADLIDLMREILADPIVLDFDGDGVELVSLTSSSTMFDLDGDGVEERVGWVGPQGRRYKARTSSSRPSAPLKSPAATPAARRAAIRRAVEA
jgi:hypothetical protein